MVKLPLSCYHQYNLADHKFGTNYYNELIKNKKTKKRTKTQRLKSLVGSIIYNSNNGKNSFDIKEDENENEIRIFVGDKHFCFFGRIDKYQDDTVIINDFKYYNDCNTIKKFEKGKGMKRLMKTMIRYIKDNYPKIKKIELSDEATLLCESNIDNRLYIIYLHRLYFLKYGMGYYQYNFGFHLTKENFKVILQKNKEMFSKFELIKEDLIKYLQELKFYQIPKIQEDLTTLFGDNNNKLNSVEISKQLELQYDCIFLDTLINYIYAETKIFDLMGKSYNLVIS